MMVASATPRELADARSVEPLGRSEPSWIPVGALDAVPSALLPRTRNLASLILALTLSALIFAGAGVQPASAATAWHKLKAGDLYVSLGSSIASGYGISVQSTSCGRSSRDYGQLVAKHFRLHLVDASCGAAVIPNVLDTPQGSNPPQLTFVTPATKLVTVAVGGNDIVYNGTAAECDNPTTCAIPTNFAAMVATMRTNLKVMIDKIKAAAPSATIVFVTYPREVPAGQLPCTRLHQFGGSGGAFHGPDARKCLRSGRQALARRHLRRPLRRSREPHCLRTAITAVDAGLQVRVRRHRLRPPPNGSRAQGDGPNDHQGPQ